MTAPPPTNLTARGRRVRAAQGLVGLLAGGGLVAWLASTDLPWVAGLATFPAFLLATLGVLQATTST